MLKPKMLVILFFFKCQRKKNENHVVSQFCFINHDDACFLLTK